MAFKQARPSWKEIIKFVFNLVFIFKNNAGYEEMYFISYPEVANRFARLFYKTK